MFIPIAEWLPDQPDYKNPGSANVLNVIPITAQSYGPMPSLNTFSAAITARCQGAYSTQDSSGNAYVFAGDATKLYELTVASTTPTDVSKVGGYSTDTLGRWSMCMYGQRVIATNYADNVQSFVVGTSTKFADLSSGAPKARYCAIVKDWLVLANTNDATNGQQPQRVWWSAIDDPTNWPTPGSTTAVSVQSDYQDIPGDHGWVMGIVGNLGTADAAIFFERAVWRMVYQGSPTIFAFEAAQGVKGTPAPGSIVRLGSTVFYLGEDGFYAFDGTSITPIGAQKIDKTFWADVDQNNLDKISSTVDPINKFIIWAYPGSGNTNGNPNKLLIYNWSINRWSQASVNCEQLIRTLSFGYSLDTLDNTGYTLDTLPFSLDSRYWTGNKAVLSAFDTSHKLAYFNGSNLAPTVDTTEIEPFESIATMTMDISPSRRALVTSVRPQVDGGTPSVAIGTRNRLVDSVTWGSAVAVNSIGECPVRANGRYIRAEITLPSASTFNHIQGVDIVGMQKDGQR